jgi:hypothetical protein
MNHWKLLNLKKIKAGAYDMKENIRILAEVIASTKIQCSCGFFFVKSGYAFERKLKYRCGIGKNRCGIGISDMVSEFFRYVPFRYHIGNYF